MLLYGLPSAVFGYGKLSIDSATLRLGKIFSLIGPIREIGLRSVLWIPPRGNGTLLDIGCGSGGFLRYMKKMGWEVLGVEPDIKAAERAKINIGIDRVYSDDIGELDDRHIKKESLDVISMIHVIEHLLDPIKTLHVCYKLLKPGGSLIIITPNAFSRGRKKFGLYWRGWEPPRHIHIFNVNSLKEISERSGFQAKSVRSTASGAFAICMLSMYLKEKRASLDLSLYSPGFKMKLKSMIFWIYEYLLTVSGKECGEEVVAILTKPG